MQSRGVHDIKTHCTLARQGKLVRVARDLHKIKIAGENGGSGPSDCDVGKHIFKEKPAMNRRPQTTHPCSDLYLNEQINAHLIRMVQDQLQEMERAMAEKIPVSASELERLRARLSRLKAE